jgi:hypothetical protein
MYHEEDTFTVSSELAKKALSKLAEYAGMSVHDSLFPYKIKSVQGNLVLLRRERPSMCKVCESIHEKEHPYLRINKVGDINFDCRRSTSHGDGTYRTLRVGNLGETFGTPGIERIEDKTEEPEDVEEISNFVWSSDDFLIKTEDTEGTSVAGTVEPDSFGGPETEGLGGPETEGLGGPENVNFVWSTDDLHISIPLEKEGSKIELKLSTKFDKQKYKEHTENEKNTIGKTVKIHLIMNDVAKTTKNTKK